MVHVIWPSGGCAVCGPATLAPMRRRWLVLGVGFVAQACVSVVLVGLPALAVELRSEFRLSLTELGLLMAAFPAGMGLAMLAWGLAADRVGERRVMGTGLMLASVALGVATQAASAAMLGFLLVTAGLASAAVNASGGRSVMGWFASENRGLAMSIRHAAMPVGGAIGAMLLPLVAHHAARPQHALAVAALGSLIAAVLVAALLSEGPLAHAEAGAKVRLSSVVRHPAFQANLLAAGLLVVPQFGLQSFFVVIAVDEAGWSGKAAAITLGVSQLIGAGGRIAAGMISDRVGSRMLPFAAIAGTSALLLAAAAVGKVLGVPGWAVSIAVATGVLTTWNALALTAAAEVVGHAATGTALGLHNSLLVLLGMATPPLVAVSAGAAGWTATLGIMVGSCALSAAVLHRQQAAASS